MTEQRDVMTGAVIDVDLEWEKEWSHATALGEAVWARVCQRKGYDAKDKALLKAHADVVDLVRGAAFVLERDGFEGLAHWLKEEGRLDGGG